MTQKTTESTLTLEPGATALAKRPFYYTSPHPLADTRARLETLAVPEAGPLPLYTREVRTRPITPRTAGLLIRVRRRLGPVHYTIVSAYGVLHALDDGQTALEGYTRFGSERLFRAAQVGLVILLALLGLVVWRQSVVAALGTALLALAGMLTWGRFQRDRDALLADLARVMGR